MNKKYNNLINAFLEVRTSGEMHDLLKSLLTDKEYNELPTRLAIFKMLHDNVPQHTIAKKLGVGVATVTRGSKELQRGYIKKTSWWRSLSPQLGG